MSRTWISIGIIISVMVVFVVVAFVMDTYVVWPKSLCFASQLTNPRLLQQKSFTRLKLGTSASKTAEPATAEPATAEPRTQVAGRASVRQLNTEKITSRFKQNNEFHDDTVSDTMSERSPSLNRPPLLQKKTARVRLILSRSRLSNLC